MKSTIAIRPEINVTPLIDILLVMLVIERVGVLTDGMRRTAGVVR